MIWTARTERTGATIDVASRARTASARWSSRLRCVVVTLAMTSRLRTWSGSQGQRGSMIPCADFPGRRPRGPCATSNYAPRSSATDQTPATTAGASSSNLERSRRVREASLTQSPAVPRSRARARKPDSSCVYMVFVVSLKQSTEHKKDITQEAGTHPSRGTSRGTGFELIVPLRSGPGTGSRSTMTRSTRQPNIAPRPSQS